MKTNIGLGGTLVVGLLVLAGCNQQSPSTPSTTLGAQANQPAAVQNGQRSVLELPAPISEDQAKQQLPARISQADAQRMLIQIDPSKIVQDDKNYSVQARGGWGGHHGSWGGHRYGRSFFGGYGFGAFAWPYYGWYGLGSYFYPYSLYGSYYYPCSYSPYLYGGLGYNSLYYPYWRSRWWW